MKNQLTTKQKESIKSLETAIKNIGKLGIQICGIDDGLLYATKEAMLQTPDCGKNYCTVADAIQFHQYDSQSNHTGEIKTGSVYVDSGGW